MSQELQEERLYPIHCLKWNSQVVTKLQPETETGIYSSLDVMVILPLLSNHKLVSENRVHHLKVRLALKLDQL